jgi:hypothetical protein
VVRKRYMHGVGLLRISRTPVTVDSEDYVVFICGWLAPRTFGSWKEAYDYFRHESKRLDQDKPHRRLAHGKRRKPGRPVGAGVYEKMTENLSG